MSTERQRPGRAGKQEVLLIRHGQSTANASGVWQGQLDFPLSEEGRLQAAEAGRALKSKEISGVYASPLARAFETAEIVAREAGYTGEIVPELGLMERHGGVLEGHTWADQEANNPEFAQKFLSLPEGERWPFAGAETDEEVLTRFEDTLSKILSRHPSPTGSLVVVSHGGVMRAFLRERFGPMVLPGDERAPNASFTWILFEASNPAAAPELLEIASTNHLAPEEERQAREQARLCAE